MAPHCCWIRRVDVRTLPDRDLRVGFFPQPQTIRLRIEGAPAHMQPLRALFFSDVHLRRCVSDAQLDALVEQIAALKPSLLLLGGDYAESEADCVRFFRALARVRAPLGAYAVPGNNDRMATDALRQTMAEAGVALLINENRRIELPGGALEIGGCDDHKYGLPDTRSRFRESNAYRILLSHFPCAPDCDCDLMLSGHTHGGQCNLLGCTPYTLGFERRYHLLALRGLHARGGMRLLVGNGIGVSRLPLRIGAQPQIYLLEFDGNGRSQSPSRPRASGI